MSVDAHPFHEQLELRLAVAAAAVWRQKQHQQQLSLAPITATGAAGTLLATLGTQSPATKRARLSDVAMPGYQDPSGPVQQDPSAIPDVAQQLLDCCWSHVFDQSHGHALALRLALVQYLMVPLLELAPRQQQQASWYALHVQQLRTMMEYSHAGAVAAATSAYEESWRLGSRWAAYRWAEPWVILKTA